MMKRLITTFTILLLIIPVISIADEFTGWWKNLSDIVITPEGAVNEKMTNILDKYFKDYIDKESIINKKFETLSNAILEGKEKEAYKIAGDIAKIRFNLEKLKIKTLIEILPYLSTTQKESLKGLIVPAYPTKIETAFPKEIEK